MSDPTNEALKELRELGIEWPTVIDFAVGYELGKKAAARSGCRHGWRGSPAEQIVDRCPRCHQKALFIGSGGYLTCGSLACKQPAVGREIELLLKERERLQAALETCRVRLERIREIDDLALEGLRAIEDATK